MRRVCDYYDRHSSKREANNRMLAHYLLGRCYDDMGEAPLALEEFHNAENAADTTIKDCDKSLILRIYGQSASIYLRQEAPLSALEVMRSADGVSRAIGDTIFLPINREQMAIAYDMLVMSDSVIAIQRHIPVYRRDRLGVKYFYCIKILIDNYYEKKVFNPDPYVIDGDVVCRMFR